MTKSSKTSCVLRSVFSAFFVILAALLALITFLAFLFSLTLTNEEVYRNAVKAPAFSEKMMGYLREELEAECLFYDLPFSVLDDAVSLEEVTRFSQGYVENMYESLVHGEPFTVPAWSAQPFVDAVQAFFNTLPPEEKPLDETAAVTVGKEFSERALSLLKAGIQEKYLEMGYRVFSHPILKKVINKRFLLLAITFVFAAAALLLDWREWRKRLYALCFALGISAAVAAIPFWLLKRYDFMKRVSLMDSPLKLYIQTMYEAVLQKAVTIAVVFFLATVLVFVLSIVLRCVSIRGKDSTQNVHTNGIDELA